MINSSNLFRIATRALIAWIFAIAIYACDTKKEPSEEEVQTQTNAVGDTTAVPPASRTIKTEPVQPQHCTLYFDISSSMKGYWDATIAGDFRGAISDIRNLSVASTAYYFDTKKHDKPFDIITSLKGGKVKWAQESDIFAMIAEIFKNANADSQGKNCYVLITDGIMSGTNAQVTGTEFNIINRELLSGRIDSIVKKYTNKDLSLLVLRYEAPFKGTYYAYNNDNKPLNNETRPFFAFLVGKEGVVNYAVEKLTTQERVKEWAQYGRTHSITLSCDKAQVLSTGEYKCVKNQTPIIYINLKNLPDYASTNDYLKQHIDIIAKEKGKSKRLAYDRDYVIKDSKIELTQSCINTKLPCTFHVGLKQEQPIWVNKYNTDNDIKSYSPLTTFNLRFLLKPFLHLNNTEYLNNAETTTIRIIK